MPHSFLDIGVGAEGPTLFPNLWFMGIKNHWFMGIKTFGSLVSKPLVHEYQNLWFMGIKNLWFMGKYILQYFGSMIWKF